jgi:hypothetical protein
LAARRPALCATGDDRFAEAAGTCQLTRDGDGRVTGFLVTTGRVRVLRFERA